MKHFPLQTTQAEFFVMGRDPYAKSFSGSEHVRKAASERSHDDNSAELRSCSAVQYLES